jgi:hypothetical protein
MTFSSMRQITKSREIAKACSWQDRKKSVWTVTLPIFRSFMVFPQVGPRSLGRFRLLRGGAIRRWKLFRRMAGNIG